MQSTVSASAAAPEAAAPAQLALFDLDGTLLSVDTNQAFGSYLVGLGWCDGGDWTQRNAAFLDDHHRGELDLHRYIDFSTAAWRGRPMDEVEAVRAAFVRDIIRPAIPAAARALVQRHVDAGDLVALVTGTNEFLAEPIAAELGIAHVLAVRLERDAAGGVTGRIDGIPSFHAGKIDRVHEWLAQRCTQLEAFDEVSFYGDSVNDIPLMERVNRPVAVNPSPQLRALALQRDWPIVQLLD